MLRRELIKRFFGMRGDKGGNNFMCFGLHHGGRRGPGNTGHRTQRFGKVRLQRCQCDPAIFAVVDTVAGVAAANLRAGQRQAPAAWQRQAGRGN